MSPRALLLLLVGTLALGSGTTALALDLSQASTRAGETVYRESCQGCHAMRYLGYAARMPAAAAATAFGKEPPDLSLMAAARGRGTEGARYVRDLLLAFNATPERNSVYPNLAMPQVFAPGDREAGQKAARVAAFLYHASDPHAGERESVGRYVVAYMVLLTALLYLVYRRVWRSA